MNIAKLKTAIIDTQKIIMTNCAQIKNINVIDTAKALEFIANIDIAVDNLESANNLKETKAALEYASYLFYEVNRIAAQCDSHDHTPVNLIYKSANIIKKAIADFIGE